MVLASPAHCFYCFDVLSSHLTHSKPLSLSEVESLIQKRERPFPSTLSAPSVGINGSSATVPNGTSLSYATTAVGSYPKSPLFITWKKTSKSGRQDLRGCIGTFEPKPLDAGLRDYAITAGLHDTRFTPITSTELPLLSCSVTLLHDFEPISDIFDWSLGTHGLQIDFVYHGRRLGATYLPDVPPEQGWSKEETLVSLMRKAGWTGRSNEWKKVELRVTRYQGSKAAVSWKEYKELVEGKWAEEVGEEKKANGAANANGVAVGA